MRIVMLGVIAVFATLLWHGQAAATTYNCFEVDKRASLGINGGIVTVSGDRGQRMCKFSVDNATVDAVGSTAATLNALLAQDLRKTGDGLPQFRDAMLGPFADTSGVQAVVQDFDAVFGPNAAKVTDCLAEFVRGAEQQFGTGSLVCVSVNPGGTFEFHGLRGTASEIVLVVGASLERSNRVILLVIPRGFAQEIARGTFRFQP